MLDDAIAKINDVIVNPDKYAHVLKAFLKNGEDLSMSHHCCCSGEVPTVCRSLPYRGLTKRPAVWPGHLRVTR